MSHFGGRASSQNFVNFFFKWSPAQGPRASGGQPPGPGGLGDDPAAPAGGALRRTAQDLPFPRPEEVGGKRTLK